MTAFIEIEAVCPVVNHIRLDSDSATTSNALANVSGLSFVLEESSHYWIVIYGLASTAAATTGIRIGAAYPAGSTGTMFLMSQSSTAGTADVRVGVDAGGSVNVQTASYGTQEVPFYALINVQTGAESGSPSTGIVGTLTIQFATEVDTSTATLHAGTCVMLKKFEQGTPTAAVTLQSPGLGASYSSSDAGIGPRSATLELKYKTDGTWTLTSEPDDSVSGTPTSGNWGTPTSAGAGPHYEVRFTASGQVGGSVSNSATDWTVMSSDVACSINASSVGGAVTGTVTITAEVRQRGTTTVGSTGSTSLSVTANTLSGE